MTKRETATLIAALRHWQKTGYQASGDVLAIACGQHDEPLEDEALDRLVVRVQYEQATMRAAITDLERVASNLTEPNGLDTDDCAHVCGDIAARFRQLVTVAAPEPTPTKLYACPDCGCTDVQTTAWVEVNTNKPTNDEGPTDYAFCPQCDSSDLRDRDLVEVDAPKPFHDDEGGDNCPAEWFAGGFAENH